MLWFLIFTGDGWHFSLLLVQCVRLASWWRVSPGQPMAIHTCAVLYGIVSVGRGLQVTLRGLLFLICLFSFYKTLAVSKVFQLMPWLVNFVFTSFVYSYVKSDCGLSSHLLILAHDLGTKNQNHQRIIDKYSWIGNNRIQNRYPLCIFYKQ